MRKDAYARSGVDLKRVRGIHRSLAGSFAATFSTRTGKIGAPLLDIGHYGGVVDMGEGRALVLHTDGVGTKLQVAIQMGRFETVGIDCIAMTVNDLVCLGSEPVALLDYIALEKEDEGLVSELTEGLVAGAREASAPIVGGETAILGSMVRGFDLVSMGVGVVEKKKLIDGSRITEGDAVVGVSSSGLHSNGYTLARSVLLANHSLSDQIEELGSSLGEALLTPTRIYVRPALRAIRKLDVHGIAHITGGSFTKMKRLVGKRRLEFELELPTPPPIFTLIQREGCLTDAEMLRTFNMGVGLCVVAPRSQAEAVVRTFRGSGFPASRIGTVRRGSGVRVNGTRIEA